jgi:hypothetical protein
VALEVEDVAHLGAAPAVDALVVVADHADVLRLAGEVHEQVELGRVRVLVLVDHQVPEAVGVLLLHRWVLLEEPRGQQQQVVEVDGPLCLQRELVEREDDVRDEIVVVALPLGLRLGLDARVLRARDDREHLAGVERAVVDVPARASRA